ncbi:hypothetical protein U1Q18_017722 [Sarracenia purpurea var. burkii]
MPHIFPHVGLSTVAINTQKACLKRPIDDRIDGTNTSPKATMRMVMTDFPKGTCTSTRSSTLEETRVSLLGS